MMVHLSHMPICCQHTRCRICRPGVRSVMFCFYAKYLEASSHHHTFLSVLSCMCQQDVLEPHHYSTFRSPEWTLCHLDYCSHSSRRQPLSWFLVKFGYFLRSHWAAQAAGICVCLNSGDHYVMWCLRLLQLRYLHVSLCSREWVCVLFV